MDKTFSYILRYSYSNEILKDFNNYCCFCRIKQPRRQSAGMGSKLRGVWEYNKLISFNPLKLAPTQTLLLELPEPLSSKSKQPRPK